MLSVQAVGPAGCARVGLAQRHARAGPARGSYRAYVGQTRPGAGRRLPDRAPNRAGSILRWAQAAPIRPDVQQGGTAAAPRGDKKYTYHLMNGGRVIVGVTDKGEGTITVDVYVDMSGTEDAHSHTTLKWGMYRATPSQWTNPEQVVPDGSFTDSTGATRSPMAKVSEGVWTASFAVPGALAPITFGCVPCVHRGPDDEGTPVDPRHSLHCGVPVGMTTGGPSPLGCSVVSKAKDGAGVTRYSVNFALFSRVATGVNLVLVRYDPRGTGGAKVIETSLDPHVNRWGDVWHVQLDGLKDLETLYYGFRVDGDMSWEDSRADPSKVLLDPYATLVRHVPEDALPENFVAEAGGSVILGSLLGARSQLPLVGFDWGESRRPNRSFEELVACEIDLRVVAGCSSVSEARRGTYLGLLEVVGRIADLGFNTVVLSNCLTFTVDGERPLSFFAPNVDLACADESSVPELAGHVDANHPVYAAQQLKMLIKGFHEVGIEVVLRTTYSQTCEGTDDMDALTLSYRGIDNNVYYRPGSLLNSNHPVVRKMIVESLRHLVLEYELDGVMVGDAENLCAFTDGHVMDAPFVAEEIAYDYQLGRALRLVAMPSANNLLPRGGERGFPHWGRWAEVPAQVTNDWLDYMFHGHGQLSAIATRLTGSPDLIAECFDNPLPGNLAAGRRPSFVWSRPIPANEKSLLQLAQRTPDGLTRLRSLLSALLLSPGIPMIPMGASREDATLAESLVSDGQGDGDPISESLIDLIQQLLYIRSVHRVVLQPFLLDQPREITWHGVVATTQPAWEGGVGEHASYIGLCVRNDQAGIYVGFNPHGTPVTASLPGAPPGADWRLTLSTSGPGVAAVKQVAPAAPVPTARVPGGPPPPPPTRTVSAAQIEVTVGPGGVVVAELEGSAPVDPAAA